MNHIRYLAENFHLLYTYKLHIRLKPTWCTLDVGTGLDYWNGPLDWHFNFIFLQSIGWFILLQTNALTFLALPPPKNCKLDCECQM